jgi:hypothetical protein
MDSHPQKGTEQMCDSKITHPQTTPVPQPGYRGPIYSDFTTLDKNIAPLIIKLWEQGYETQASCEGWPYGSDGEKRYGTRGYILFRTLEQAMQFFQACHDKFSAKGLYTPKLVLETAIGLSEDMQYLDEALPPRGTVRFAHADLKMLEELWLS